MGIPSFIYELIKRKTLYSPAILQIYKYKKAFMRREHFYRWPFCSRTTPYNHISFFQAGKYPGKGLYSFSK